MPKYQFLFHPLPITRKIYLTGDALFTGRDLGLITVTIDVTERVKNENGLWQWVKTGTRTGTVQVLVNWDEVTGMARTALKNKSQKSVDGPVRAVVCKTK